MYQEIKVPAAIIVAVIMITTWIYRMRGMCAEHYALSKQQAIKQCEEVGAGRSSISNRKLPAQPPTPTNDSSTEDEADTAAAAASAATAQAAAASLDYQRVLPGMNVLMGQSRMSCDL